MEGGELLGQGTFGCVFNPPLLCHKSKYKAAKGEVGKITEAIDYVNEKMAYTMLNHVKGSYFVLLNPESECIPKNVKEQTDKNIGDCDLIKKYSKDNIIHFTMPYGGIGVRKYYHNLKPGASHPISLLSFAKHILEGGVHLALNGYVHYDIHLENILLKDNTLEPQFIDFGMSFSSKSINNNTLNERWKVYSPLHDPEPPEVTCITGIRMGLKLDKVLNDMYVGRRIFKTGSYLLNMSPKQQIVNFIKFWKTSHVCNSRDWVAFFKLYWTGFDSWGIGVILTSILSHTQMYYTNPEEIEGISKVKAVIRGLISMDPRSRLDCLEALSHLDPTSPILMSAAGKSWLKERTTIRKLIDKPVST